MSSLHGVTIYIYEDTLFTAEPVYGELHVLDSGKTILHYAGHNSQKRTISFWLLNVQDYNILEEAYRSGTEVTFVGWLNQRYRVVIKELSVIEALWDIKRIYNTVLKVRATLYKIADL